MPRRLHAAAFVAALGLLVAGCGGEGLKDPDPPVGTAQLPDIVPSPPEHVQMSTEGGGWHMQFSSVLVNIGEGDFVLRAKRDPEGGWAVDQVVDYSESGGEVVPTPAILLWGGDGHDHWHVERVAANTLVRLDAAGRPVPGKTWSDTKIGFCFYDFIRHKRTGVKEAQYEARSCGNEGSRYIGMGLSKGWADVYALNLPGQEIDVTKVPDGRYRLYAVADEQRWFREATTANNRTWVDVELSTRGKNRFAKVTATGPDPGKRVVHTPHAP